MTSPDPFPTSASAPRSSRVALRQSLRQVSDRSNDLEIEAVAEQLVVDAMTAAKPLMSIGARLRHGVGHLSLATRARLRDAAHRLLRKRREEQVASAPPPPSVGEWLTVREAARRQGITEATLLGRLRHAEHRQRLGWPSWDGYRWSIAAAVVDPERRAGFLLSQPDSEPLSHLLPPSCRLAVGTAGSGSSSSEEPSTAVEEVMPCPATCDK
jgi:hypothetical protein